MSRLVFGTGGRFGRLDPQLASSLVNFAWSLGIRTFDTGFYYSRGQSQSSLFQALGSRLSDAECLVTTKVKPDSLMAEYAIRSTLLSLPKGYIDVCFLWGGSAETLNNPELISLLQSMLDSGLVRRFGLNTHNLSLMNRLPSLKCYPYLSDLMIDYNLLLRDREPIIERSKQDNLRVWAGTSLAQGYLIESPYRQFLRTRSLSYLARFLLNQPTRDLASKARSVRLSLRSTFPSTCSQLPLAFVLDNPHVDFIPIGMMSQRSLLSNLFIENNLSSFSSELLSLPLMLV